MDIRDDTRSRIKEQAIKLVLEHGFEHTSVRSIAAAVEMTQGNIYTHFASKDALLRAIVEDIYTAYGIRIAAIFQRDAPFHEHIEELVALVCRLHEEDPLRFEFVLLYGQRQYTAGISNAHKPANILIEAIRRAVERHEVISLDPARTTALLIGGLRESANFVRAGLIDNFRLNYSELVATCDRLLPPDPAGSEDVD